MSIQKNINKNLTKLPATANFKIQNLFIVLFGVAVAFVAFFSVLVFLNSNRAKEKVAQETVDDQIYKLSKKSELSNFNIEDKKNVSSSSDIDEETGLPIVDQEELGKKYIKNLKEIIETLEQQIQTEDEKSIVDFDAVKIIKKRVMSEIVPGQYQSLHLDFIFALDSIINGDVDEAMSVLNDIKNNI